MIFDEVLDQARHRGTRALKLLVSSAARSVYRDREFAEGWTVLREALTIRPRSGDRFWEEEVYRLNGELLLAEARANPEAPGSRQRARIETEAETCFQRPVETAREQRTKSLELRAATSLARLWKQQGKKKEAHQMLSEIYNWFTEGFDTKDLKDAKTLLEKLSS